MDVCYVASLELRPTRVREQMGALKAAGSEDREKMLEAYEEQLERVNAFLERVHDRTSLEHELHRVEHVLDTCEEQLARVAQLDEEMPPGSHMTCPVHPCSYLLHLYSRGLSPP